MEIIKLIMESLINWIENHPTFFAILSFILSIFTWLANRKSADIAQKEFMTQNRPYVLIFFELHNDASVCFCVKNIGSEPAQNVHILINDGFIQNAEKFNLSSDNGLADLKNKRLFLMTNQSFSYIVGGIRQYKEIEKEIAHIDLTYESLDAVKYTGHIDIDFSQYEGAYVFNSPLDKIANNTKEMQNRYETY